MSKMERANLIFNDMKQSIENSKNPNINPNSKAIEISQNSRDTRAYMALPNNKYYHLEIIKRSFTKNIPYTDPIELQNQFNEYFSLCYKFSKLPTIEDLCLYAGISINAFKHYCDDTQSLFNEVSNKALSFIHSITQQATLERFCISNCILTPSKKLLEV